MRRWRFRRNPHKRSDSPRPFQFQGDGPLAGGVFGVDLLGTARACFIMED
jgi:hypothetical protein